MCDLRYYDYGARLKRTQKELLNLFKSENKAKVDALQKEIEQLSASFLKLTVVVLL